MTQVARPPILLGLNLILCMCISVSQAFVSTTNSPLKLQLLSTHTSSSSLSAIDGVGFNIDHNTIETAMSTMSTMMTAAADVADSVDISAPDYIPGTSGEVTYSKASYYVILGLYTLSFPGLWSTIKRSTKAKVKRKIYVSKGEKSTEGDGKSQREQAGEIMAYMKANNYEIVDAGETITFQGVVQRSISQACFLVFCGAIGLASFALVLSIQFNTLELPIIGSPNWYYLVLLSPYAGVYYWRSGDRIDEFAIKLETNDDETENSINVQGSEDEIERMWRALEWQEKGMVKVAGLLGE